MTQETMTIHQALCDVKVLGVRIQKELNNLVACSYKKCSSMQVDGIAVPDFVDNAHRSYQKICDLIARNNAIKRAISQSNAETVISVNGVDMTVAHAIYENEYGIAFKNKLLSTLTEQYNNAVNGVIESNESLDERCDAYISSTFGGKDKAADPVAVSKAREAYIINNTCELVDPLSLQKKIDALQSAIDGFMSSIDAALQTSNAVTTITIEY